VAGAILLSLGAVAGAAPTAPSAPLVLEQSVNGQVQCVSPDGSCVVANLYGPAGSPQPPMMFPGDQFVTTVQLRNVGTLPSSNLLLSAGACQNQAMSGVGQAPDLCGTVTVSIACTSGGGTFSFGPVTLPDFAQAGTLTVDDGLAVGQAATCRFTTTYPEAPTTLSEAARAVQSLTWAITADEPPPTTPPPHTSRPSGSTATTPPGPGALAFTGGDALPLVLAGLALLLLGGLLLWRSRPGGLRPEGPGPPPADP
jgi:hypothetical protein